VEGERVSYEVTHNWISPQNLIKYLGNVFRIKGPVLTDL